MTRLINIVRFFLAEFVVTQQGENKTDVLQDKHAQHANNQTQP